MKTTRDFPCFAAAIAMASPGTGAARAIRRLWAAACTLPALWLNALVAAACMAAATAWAAPLPAAVTFVECSADGINTFDAVFCQEGNVPGTPGFATATAFSSSPFVTARASEPSNALGAGAGAELNYHFQVVGGRPGDTVPIRIETSLDTDSSSLSSASATLLYHTTAAGPAPSVVTVCSGPARPPDCIGFQGYSAAIKTQALSGSVDDFVTLHVTASAVATPSSSEWANATADPYIFVDPDFPNANLYSIVVSPGVINAVPVPEPEPRNLFGAGLAVLALLRYFSVRRPCMV